MNVDKFGHHVHKRQRLNEVVRIECPLKRIDGDNLSVENKRLQNLKDPQELNDAVTKNYTDKAISDYWVNHIKQKYFADLYMHLDKLERKINDRFELIKDNIIDIKNQLSQTGNENEQGTSSE